jgi:hypothetical protein
LPAPEPQGARCAAAAPDQPSGHADQDIEPAPDRAEDPAGRCRGRGRERGVPPKRRMRDDRSPDRADEQAQTDKADQGKCRRNRSRGSREGPPIVGACLLEDTDPFKKRKNASNDVGRSGGNGKTLPAAVLITNESHSRSGSDLSVSARHGQCAADRV